VAIEEIDVRVVSDSVLLEIHEVEAACSPLEPFREPSLSLAYYRHWSDGIRRRFVARDGNEIVGAAVLMVPTPTFVQAELFVLPGARRRGHGTALLASMRSAAQEAGAKSFFAHHGDAAGAAFARAAGAVDDQRDIVSELRLREARLSEPVVPPGWRLLSWRGAVDAGLVESYARARAAIDDAPAPGDLVYDEIDVQWVRAMEATAAARGREIHATVAVDDAGEVGAFTDVRTSPPPSRVASTDDTATLPHARRLGLSTAVKLASLRGLRDRRPDVEVVRTLNAEHNVGMRAVNTGIGFVPVVALTTSVLTL
jgi:GNAT superfamily N-acetyltransferase